MADSLVINLPIESLSDKASQNLARLAKSSGIKIDVSRSKNNMSIFLRTEKQLSYEKLDQIDLELFKYQIYDRACKHVTKKIDIEREDVAKIIGKKGIRIKQLQKTFAVKLQVDNEGQMTLVGHSQSIDDCLKEINHSQNSKFILEEEEMVLFLLELKHPHSDPIPKNVKSIVLGPSLHFLDHLFSNVKKSTNDHSLVFNGVVDENFKELLKKLKVKLNFSSLQIPSLELPQNLFSSIQAKVFLENAAYLKKDGSVMAQKDNLIKAMQTLLTVQEGFHCLTVPLESESELGVSATDLKQFFNLPEWQSKFDMVQASFNNNQISFYAKNPTIKALNVTIKDLGLLYPTPVARGYTSPLNKLLLNSFSQNNVESLFPSINNHIVCISISTNKANLNKFTSTTIPKLIKASQQANPELISTEIHPKFNPIPFLKSTIEEMSTKDITCSYKITSTKVELYGPNSLVTKISKQLSEKNTEFAKEHQLLSFTDQCTLPQSIIPLILGKGGVNLNKYKIDGIVSIDIPRRTNNSILEVTITIQGKQQAVQTVIKQFKELVKQVENTITEKIDITTNFPYDILTQFQKHYHVKIDFNNSAVNITGGSPQVKSCRADLQRYLDFNSSGTSELQVPSTVIPWLIGKSGSRISQLKDFTQCQIQTPKASDDPERTITIVGNNHMLCKQVILYLLDYYYQDRSNITLPVDPLLVNHKQLQELLDEVTTTDLPSTQTEREALVIASMMMNKLYTQLSPVNFRIGKELSVYGYNSNLVDTLATKIKSIIADTVCQTVKWVGCHHTVIPDIEQLGVKLNQGSSTADALEWDSNGKYVHVVGNRSNVDKALEKMKKVQHRVLVVDMTLECNQQVYQVLQKYKVYSKSKKVDTKEIYTIEGQEDDLKCIKDEMEGIQQYLVYCIYLGELY